MAVIKQLPFDLAVVELKTILCFADNSFCTELNKTGIFLEDLTPSEEKTFSLYYVLRLILKMQQEHGKKNLIVYNDKTKPYYSADDHLLKAFLEIRKTFPIMYLEGNIPIEKIETVGGAEHLEFMNMAREYRYSFDFSKFSPRKEKIFLNKKHIKLENPA